METTRQQQSDFYIGTEPGVKLYVRDYGSGKPVILIHGWPLSGDMWEYQMDALVNAGFRVIAYDRRGFGQSSKPWNGYNYDVLANDLAEIIDQLALTDVAIAGFSMGGGEVVRFFSKFGGRNVTKAVLISSIAPYMLKTEDNPEGVPQEEFDKMTKQMKEDRAKFLKGFSKDFYGVTLLTNPASDALLERDFIIASGASPRATLECAAAFSSTDFRSEMQSINVPALVIHGDADKTVPIEATGEKAAHAIPDCRYLVYEGAPHGLFYTERERLNEDLIEFLNS